LLCDAACQKLLKSANAALSHSNNKSGPFFIETRGSKQGMLGSRAAHTVALSMTQNPQLRAHELTLLPV